MADGGQLAGLKVSMTPAHDRITVESICAAFGPRVGDWAGLTGARGGAGREGLGAEVAFACRGAGWWDLALLLWTGGQDGPEIAQDVLRTLRADAARVEAGERAGAPLRGRGWPPGRRQALAWLAREELRPQGRAAELSARDRLVLLQEGLGVRLSEQGWGQHWAGRYTALLGRAQGRVGSALRRVRQARGG